MAKGSVCGSGGIGEDMGWTELGDVTELSTNIYEWWDRSRKRREVDC